MHILVSIFICLKLAVILVESLPKNRISTDGEKCSYSLAANYFNSTCKPENPYCCGECKRAFCCNSTEERFDVARCKSSSTQPIEDLTVILLSLVWVPCLLIGICLYLPSTYRFLAAEIRYCCFEKSQDTSIRHDIGSNRIQPEVNRRRQRSPDAMDVSTTSLQATPSFRSSPPAYDKCSEKTDVPPQLPTYQQVVLSLDPQDAWAKYSRSERDQIN